MRSPLLSPPTAAIAAFCLWTHLVAGQSPDSLALSLPDAVAIALRSGDESRQAAAQVSVADAQVDIARAGGLPQLRLNSSYLHTYASSRGQAVGAVFNQPNTYSAVANATQSVFQGGRVIAGLRAANRLERAARLSESEIRAQVSLDVQRAYLQALFAARMVEIQRSNAALASSRLTQVEQLQAAGRAARYDVLRARVERANLEPVVLQSLSDREIALLDLKRLLNLPLERPVILTTTIDSATVAAVLASVEAAQIGGDSLPVENRPAVRAAELTALARHDAISIARANLLPTVSVFGNLGYAAYPLRGFPTTLGTTTSVSTPCTFVRVDGGFCTRTDQNGGFFSDKSVGVQLSWAIFDGLQTKASIDLADAQARLADIQLSQQREQAALEIARARAELTRARSAYSAQQQTVSEANEAFQLASLRFSRGLGTQLDVSDAQVALLTAQTTGARSTYDLFLASAGLARALGRPIPLLPGASLTPRRSGIGATSTGTTSAPLRDQTPDR
ncbi:MAG: TolC family protein [Gemmatimonadaceae bacterium]